MDELKHDVRDTDAHFTLNLDTRELINNTGKKLLLIQRDNNSERFTFKIPRMIDGHDISLCNFVQVHFNNIEVKTKEESKGVYLVDDMHVSQDDDFVILSWLISHEATKYVGSLNFIIRFSCINEDGSVDYVWQTAKYTKVSIGSGIDNGEAVDEEYHDILANWEAKINAGLSAANSIVVDFTEAVDDAERLLALKKVMEQNKGVYLSLWVGTQEEYDALETTINNCLYVITNDTTFAELATAVLTLQNRVADIDSQLANAEESGTWTPYLNCIKYDGTRAGAPKYNDIPNGYGTEGFYHVIGNLVYVSCVINKRLVDPGDGYAVITGLPFIPKARCAFSSYWGYGAINKELESEEFVEGDATVYSMSGAGFVSVSSANGKHSRRWKLKVPNVGNGSAENDVLLGFSGVFEKE